GSGALREFHQCDRLPWGSVSISATGPTPALCASTARCPESVVFPVPPFCDAKTRICTCALSLSCQARQVPPVSLRLGRLPCCEERSPQLQKFRCKSVIPASLILC